jgi:hypothetical protein
VAAESLRDHRFLLPACTDAQVVEVQQAHEVAEPPAGEPGRLVEPPEFGGLVGGKRAQQPFRVDRRRVPVEICPDPSEQFRELRLRRLIAHQPDLQGLQHLVTWMVVAEGVEGFGETGDHARLSAGASARQPGGGPCLLRPPVAVLELRQDHPLRGGEVGASVVLGQVHTLKLPGRSARPVDR